MGQTCNVELVSLELRVLNKEAAQKGLRILCRVRVVSGVVGAGLAVGEAHTGGRVQIDHVGHHGISAAYVEYGGQPKLALLPDVLDLVRKRQSIVVVQESLKILVIRCCFGTTCNGTETYRGLPIGWQIAGS